MSQADEPREEQRPSARRRGRFRRFALATGAVLLLLLLVVGGVLAWLVATPSGLQFAVAQARPYLPEGTRIESVEGRLIGPLRVEGLRVETAAARVRVDRIELEWWPGELLGGTVHVSRLGVDGVGVELAAAAPAAEPSGPVEMPPLPGDVALPVAIVVEALEVAPITITTPAGVTHRIDRVALSARVDGDALALESLRIEAPDGRLEAALRIGPRRPHPVSGTIRWHWRGTEGIPPLAGNGHFDGTLADLRVEHELTAPTAVTLRAALRLFRDRPEWRARLEVPTTHPAEWLAQAPAMSVSLGLDLKGTFERVSARGEFELGDLPGGSYRGRVDVTADTESARFDRLEIRPLAVEGSRATVSGTVDYAAAEPRFDLVAEWQSLQWPLDAAPTVRSPGGRVTVAGTPGDYRIDGNARVEPVGVGPPEPAAIELQADGSREGLDPVRARVDWAGARADLEGRARWAEPGSARARVDLQGVDPARFGAAVTGDIGAGLEASVDWSGPALRAEVELRQLTGTLDGRAVQGSGRARYADGTLELPRLRVAAGEARLEASGRAGESLAFDWSLVIPDVNALAGTGGGRVSGEGRITGTPAAPAIRGRLEGRALEWADVTIGELVLEADAVLAPERRSRIDLRARDITAAGETVTRVEAGLDGSLGSHSLALEVQAARGALDLALAGGLDGADWRGRVTAARVQPAGGDPWTLAEPAGLRWVEGRATLEPLCLAQEGARLCAAGEGALQRWSARLEARTIPLALLGAFGPEELEYAGSFDAQADFTGGDGPVTGEARVDLTRGSITGTVDEERRTLMAWEPGAIDATLSAGRVDARLQLPLADGGRLAASLGLGRGDAAEIDGRLQARIDDLGLAAALVPQIGDIEGRLVADLGLSGTLSDPKLEGTAQLQEGRVAVQPLGIDVTGIGLELTTLGSGFRVDLTGDSGDGRMHARIELRRGPGGKWIGEGRIDGERFVAADLPELELTVSPDLRWRVEGRDIRVDGAIDIPQAMIAPRDLSGTVQTSPDAVIVHDNGETVSEQGWRIFADVEVTLGDDVRIDAFGLEGRLGGEIRVREKPGRLTTATGELRVEEGTYTIYRQTLQIVRGRVLFDGGPIADPGLDVRAVRRPRDVVVGVNVRGTLRNPRASLFSEPPMQQSQQLSYLIAGVPLNESSGSERSTMAAAAAALATTEQGRNIADKLGIEEVSVDYGEGANEGASLVLGRYLSPRLYVGYGIGLAEQANSVRMRYELTRRWSIEAQSGANASADLLYSIETNGEPEP